jgi:hypothetical protein
LFRFAIQFSRNKRWHVHSAPDTPPKAISQSVWSASESPLSLLRLFIEKDSDTSQWTVRLATSIPHPTHRRRRYPKVYGRRLNPRLRFSNILR